MARCAGTIQGGDGRCPFASNRQPHSSYRRITQAEEKSKTQDVLAAAGAEMRAHAMAQMGMKRKKVELSDSGSNGSESGSVDVFDVDVDSNTSSEPRRKERQNRSFVAQQSTERS